MFDANHRSQMRHFSSPVLKTIIHVVFNVLVGLLATSLVLVAVFSYVPVPITPLAFIRGAQAVFSGREIHFSKDWIEVELMAPHLLRAAIASEDFRFVEHNGFDFPAIQKAIAANERVEKRGRGRIRGGSTISQQTAKNVFLFPSRTWLRKGLEAWMTVLIESMWSKRRILEVYLNVVEFGDGIYGAEAASKHFFGKSARRINASEAALLIAVLPNPRKLSIARPSSYVRYRQSAILRRLSYVDLP